MPVSISKLPEVTNVKDNSFMLITQDGTTKRTMCDQFVTEEEARLDEFSPTVITSKSMSKTGEGDNVDYSSSAYDAPMKDVVLKGKTLVNCIQEPSSQDVVLPYEFEEGQYVTINDTKESGALGVELKGRTLVNCIKIKNHATTTWPVINLENVLLQPNKKYIAILKHLPLDCQWAITNNGEKTTHIPYNKSMYAIFTSASTITDLLLLHINKGTQTDLTLEELKKVQPMIIEYQEGMENWDIPFFEGMASCKMPILHTVGKNLFDGIIEKGNINISNGEIIDGNTSYRSVNYTKIKMNTIYFIQTNQNAPIGIRLYDVNKNFISSNSLGANSYFNSGNAHFVKFVFVTTLNLENIQLEEGSTATSYEPYKSSILSTNEDLELRGIGDVQDALDLNTGKLTSYYGERIVTEDDSFSTTLLDGKCTCIVGNMTDKISSYASDNFLADKVPHGAPANTDFGIYQNLGNFVIYETGDDLEAFKSKVIGTKIYYRLAEPVNKAVDLKVVDQNSNVIPTLKSWNTTTHIYSEIPENSLYPILSHSNPTYPVILKPSTKYSIVANSYSNDHTNSTINFNLGGATASTTVGNRVTTITTPSTLTSEELVMSGRGNKLNNVMVIEGDVVGDEPYFEGICDCKSPILSNIGKNLFNINGEINEKFSNIFANDAPNTVDGNTIIASSWTGNHHGKGQKIKVKRGKLYTCSFTTSDNGNVIIHTPKKVNFTSIKSSTFTFTAPTDCDEIVVAFNTYGASSGGKIHNLCVVEGDVTSVEYEPYKSNTTTFEQKDDKTIVLRSLPDGTCDTLNVETGEYVQRIGANFVSGEVIESINDWGNDNNKRYCYIRISKKDLIAPNRKNNGANYKNLICDKLPTTNSITVNGSFSITHNGATSLIFCFAKDYTTCDEQVAEVKRWAKSNGGFTIQYELETPIVRKVDLSGFPYAYKDGHVILSSGSIEQSLTPKIEYNIATNRGGQITQNTKSLIRQGKLLDDIEGKINQIIEATINNSIMLMKLRNK